MGCLLSVIVPVYNVKLYLGICLETIARQTDKDFELILVDDGSTDGSEKLCDEYKASHNNVVVIHQANQGLGMARNVGIDNSTGEYLSFIDSDDYISLNFIEILKKNIIDYQADISISGMQLCFGDGIYKVRNERKRTVEVFDSETALESMLYGYKYGVQAWNKIYKRELIINNHFPNVRAHEDLGMMYKVISQAGKIIYCPNVIYYYRQRGDSINHIKFSDTKLYGLVAAKEQLDYVRAHYPNLVTAAEQRIFMTITKWVRSIVESNDKLTFQKMQEEVRPYYTSIMQNAKVKKSMKLRCFAFCKGMFLAKLVYCILDRVKLIKDKSRTRVADISELI